MRERVENLQQAVIAFTLSTFFAVMVVLNLVGLTIAAYYIMRKK